MRRPSLARCAVLALALGLFAASCAPLPAPAPPATPPAPTPAPSPPPPTPAETAPPVPEVPVRGDEPWITVGLAVDLSGLTIETEGAAVVEGPSRRALSAGDQFFVQLHRPNAVGRLLSRGASWRMTITPAETLWITPESQTALRWNGRRWRGQFKVFLNPRGMLTLAVRLPLETYLVGVVPGEIGALSEELIEAGRAQAVAARSYTLFYRGRRAAEGFDLYATVEDQVYGSLESERSLATRCVESTAGEVALSSGQPIRANYCSTCGGITADVWEAWPADPLPYLVSRRDATDGAEAAQDYCAMSPHFRWREEWPAPEFLSNLTRFGRASGVPLPPGWPGRLLDVRVDSRSRSGRVWRLRIETSAGEVTVPAWSLRQVLRRPGNASAILRSNLFKIDVRRNPVSGGVTAVVASGAGSGHGVGLCQTGALGMARAGRGADDILRHYYHGVELRRLY